MQPSKAGRPAGTSRPLGSVDGALVGPVDERPEASRHAVLGRRDWLATSVLALSGLAFDSCAEYARPSTPEAPRALRASLSLNENPFGPSPLAIDGVRAGLAGLARYTGVEAEAFQRQIASVEGVPPDQVLLGDSLEALGVHLALQGGPGGEFVYSQPGYTGLVDAAQSAGGLPVPVPLDALLANDLPSLRAKVGDRTRALFLVNPHNPSGTLSDPVALGAFIREASKRTLVIVDEAYLEFTEDFDRRTCVGLVRAGDNVAVFRTFSKIYGLAALPIGYAVLPAKLADLLRGKGIGHPHALNRLSVVAAAASLRDTSYVRSVREKVMAERARWFAALRALNVRYTESYGNFVFFETGRPHDEFASAMSSAGVEIGRSFPPLDRWARISVGLPEENALAQDVVRRILT